MLYIVANPRVYAELQREIDETVASGQASGVVPDAVAKDLAYLQAVLREGFRMRPPVTDVVPKKVPAGGDTVVVDGESVFLPGGTNIGYSVNGLHSRKDIFGQDADIFRPERWIPSGNGEDAERVAEMKKTTELIFGYGKYQCLGKNIGWMEYGKAIFEVRMGVLGSVNVSLLACSFSDTLTLRLQIRRILGRRRTIWGFSQVRGYGCWLLSVGYECEEAVGKMCCLFLSCICLHCGSIEIKGPDWIMKTAVGW